MKPVCLIVDPSNSVRRLLCRMVRDLGFSPVLAADPGDALALVFKGSDGPGPAEAALIPWINGVQDGVDALIGALKRQVTPATPCGARVVVTTTCACMTTLQSALAAGADDVLMKPFDRETVAGKMVPAGVLV